MMFSVRGSGLCGVREENSEHSQCLFIPREARSNKFLGLGLRWTCIPSRDR